MPLIPLALVALTQARIEAIRPTSISISSKSVEGLQPLAFAAAPSGSKFAMTMDDNSIRIMDASTKQTLKVLKGHNFPARALAWSADGEYLASGDESARVIIWNMQTGQRVRTVIGHQRPINKLSFNSSRTMLVSDGDDSLLCLWNVASGKKVGELRGGNDNLFGASFSPKSDLVIVGCLAGGAKMYRITPGGFKLMNFMNFANPNGQVHGVMDAAIAPNGKFAATGANDGLSVLWDVATYRKLGTFRGHDSDAFLRKVAFSPNSRLLATGGTDRTVHLWDTSTFKSVETLPDECAIGSPLAFTSDGKYLLSVNVSDNLQITALTPAQSSAPAKPAKPVRRKGH